jgi:hypothetical protein
VALLIIGTWFCGHIGQQPKLIAVAQAEDPTTTTWTGSGLGWHDANNWTNGVPNDSVVAIIPDWYSCTIGSWEDWGHCYELWLGEYAFIGVYSGLIADEDIVGEDSSSILLSGGGEIHADRIDPLAPGYEMYVDVEWGTLRVDYLRGLHINDRYPAIVVSRH